MNLEFEIHNSHLADPATFPIHDPHLRRLQEQVFIHRSHLLDLLPRSQPGVYSIGGGRQIGKTTLLKQWMEDLLRAGVAPPHLRFFTGELIDDHHALVRILTELLQQMPADGINYILLDEVTYIRDWDKAVKYAADAGLLEKTELILTGSDLLIIQEARMRFPGRRGQADIVDFHLHPLSFGEVLKLKDRLSSIDLQSLPGGQSELSPEMEQLMLEEFTCYLAHGGFLTAINDLARFERVLPATFNIYSDWIRGDLLKRGKQENYLREILSAIARRHGTQVTWNALARDLSIDHPTTVGAYTALLSSMDAVFVQPALIEDKLTGAPKKARKIVFKDPFIFHALKNWLNPVDDPYAKQVLPCLDDPNQAAHLVEACVATHFARHFPTYYIKAEGEIDIAYVDGDRFWPVEVKWTEQLRPKTLKQAAKYPNSRILAKNPETKEIAGIKVDYLPLALLHLDTAGPGGNP